MLHSTLLTFLLFATVSFAFTSEEQDQLQNKIDSVVAAYQQYRGDIPAHRVLHRPGNLPAEDSLQKDSATTMNDVLMHRHWPKPDFLRKVSHSARREYFKIVRDMNLTRNQKMKLLKEWAEKQGPEIVKGLEKYGKELDELFSRIDKNSKDIVSHIDGYYDKVHKIVEDGDLTPSEMKDKIETLKIPRATGRALRAIFFIATHTRPEGEGTAVDEE